MSRLYNALRQSELERAGQRPAVRQEPSAPADLLRAVETQALGFEQTRALRTSVRPQSRLVALTDERSLGAEKFRLLSTRLKHLQGQRQLKKLLLTSSVSDEGKSLLVANLALTLARHFRQNVLLLEGDLRQPTLTRLLGLGELAGLSEYLQTEEPITKFLYRLEGMPLWLLPAGTTPDRPLRLLQSNRLTELLQRLTGYFDWVLIDAPPLLLLADANWWARITDGILLVVRQRLTPKKLLQKALERLDHPAVIGVVLNDATGEDHNYLERYYPNGVTAGNGRKERQKTGGPV